MSQILTFSARPSEPAGFDDDNAAAELAVTRLLDGHDLDRAQSRALFEIIV